MNEATKQNRYGDAIIRIADLESERDALKAACAVKDKALEPFAAYADVLAEGSVNHCPDLCPVNATPGAWPSRLTVGDLRRAHEALSLPPLSFECGKGEEQS